MAKTNYHHARPSEEFDVYSEGSYFGKVPTEDALVTYATSTHVGASDHLSQGNLTARLGEIIRPEIADKLKGLVSRTSGQN